MPIHGTDGEPVNCTKTYHPEFRDCPKCGWRAAVHCESCEIQITGCKCTIAAKAKAEEEAEANEHSRLWRPGQGELN